MFGLEKGKMNTDWLAMRLHQLADSLEAYSDDSFKLDEVLDRC
jgi:hypothetical protein